jgi:hypothetical protein
MLPQLTKARALVSELGNEALFDGMYKAGPLLLEISSFQQHEGKAGSFQVASGEIENIDFKKESVEMTSSAEPGRGKSLKDILAVMAKGGADMGAKLQDNIVKGVEAATEKVGNVVTIKNGVITPEAFLEMMEKVEIDFDESGQSQSSWFLPPETAAELEKNYQTWQQDPRLKAKLAEVERKKKEQFRARETNRRLAR